MHARGPLNRPVDAFRNWVLLATGTLLLAWLPAILYRSFDADELEHSHAAWCVWRGMLPYRDFFEHHTPWYYYGLRPFFHGFDVAGSVEGARHFLLLGRGLSLLLTLLSVFLVVRTGRLWQRRDVGLLAGLLLVSQPVFFEKSIEIRPDVLALPWFLGSLWLLLRGLASSTWSARRGLRWFLAGGVSLGAAIMCTQKMLFVLPGMLVGLGIWALLAGRPEARAPATSPSARVGRGPRILLILVFLASACVPAGLTWAAFAYHQAGDEFITNNFLLNARWKHVETYQLGRVIATSWPLLALGTVGVGIWLVRFVRSGGRSPGGLLLFCTMMGLFAGVAVIPSAHAQYYLMPLPLVCWFAASGLLFLVELAQRRVRPALLVIALLALGLLPARALRDSLAIRNDVQLARLQYVFEHTRPEDVVMDGWQGLGVFRPHAFYYFFLHRETLAMLPDRTLAAFLTALERGEVRPTLIALDVNLAALGPRFLAFVHMNYLSSHGFFYLRRGFWRTRPGDMLREVVRY